MLSTLVNSVDYINFPAGCCGFYVQNLVWWANKTKILEVLFFCFLKETIPEVPFYFSLTLFSPPFLSFPRLVFSDHLVRVSSFVPHFILLQLEKELIACLEFGGPIPVMEICLLMGFSLTVVFGAPQRGLPSKIQSYRTCSSSGESITLSPPSRGLMGVCGTRRWRRGLGTPVEHGEWVASAVLQGT